MKLTKPQIDMLSRIEDAGMMDWSSILVIPNGTKQISTRMSRNAVTAQSLVSIGYLRHASVDQIIAARQAFDRQTTRIVGHLKLATEKSRWKIVARLAETLEFRNFDQDIYVVSHPQPASRRRAATSGLASRPRLTAGNLAYACDLVAEGEQA